jgi:putative NIF3 family GTP cyclohydrolase 1 type 2
LTIAKKNCNLVVCFHPILFSGLKKITGKLCGTRHYQSHKNDIAIYAVPALDNHQEGVNKIFNALGLINTNPYSEEHFIRKLVTYDS